MTFRQILQQGEILLLDGAMGTMLQAAGLPAGVSPDVYCLEQPDILRKIHQAYLKAGANIITTCTFGGNPFKLQNNLDVFVFNKRMAEVARQAVQDSDHIAFVAGNVGPSGQFVKPLGTLEPSELIAGFALQIQGLVAGGVDLIFIETQFDLAEARAAVVAARQVCDLPLIVSMTFEQGVSLTGSTPSIFAETMQNLGVDVIGSNCSTGPDQMLPVIQEILAVSSTAVLAEPNAGLPELRGDVTIFPLEAEPFAEKTALFAEAGATLLGGCCGTTPEHIATLARKIRGRTFPPRTHPKQDYLCLTTRSNLVRIGQHKPFALIGERINPTGKKTLTQELQRACFTEAFTFADQQIADRAQVLDVNVGAPLVDETKLLPELVLQLTARTGVPLSLDSSNAEAVAQALPYCPGSCLVNSISGEQQRMEKLGPLCKMYGAPFILLPLQGSNLPHKATERIAIAENLLRQAEQLGLPRRLIMIDLLALTVSSDADGGRQCLAMAQWCREQGLPSTLGLSNISFGLPARDLLNASFLCMAAGVGLNSCIANPGALRVREAVDAVNLLAEQDPHAEFFISTYTGWQTGKSNQQTVQFATSDQKHGQKNLYTAVLTGDKENVLPLVDAELQTGREPFAIVQDILIPAITEVGKRYEKKEYFLPQLIRSAETMQTAFQHLKPELEKKRGEEKRPVIVMATVEGDIHDIGKNIVALLLGNHGFDVVDAGKDVAAEDIVSCALKHHACIIGLSALMTTTMVRMQDTIRILKDRHLPIKVMVGGAAVTQAFADAIGADAYCPDAVHAVHAAKTLLATLH